MTLIISKLVNRPDLFKGNGFVRPTVIGSNHFLLYPISINSPVDDIMAYADAYLAPIQMQIQLILYPDLEGCLANMLTILPMLKLGDRVEPKDFNRLGDDDYMADKNKLLSMHRAYKDPILTPMRAIFKFYTNNKGKRILVVKSGTGTGKTTLIPIFTTRVGFADKKLIGGGYAKVLCTQPRRYNATSGAETSQKMFMKESLMVELATRGREDTLRGVFFDAADYSLSQYGRSKVRDMSGYHIGGAKGASQNAVNRPLCFETEQLFLNRLQQAEDKLKFLRKYSHIFIDEVHERNSVTDTILALLKKYWLIAREKNKRDPSFPFVVIMSATMDPIGFLEYFGIDMDEDFDDRAYALHPAASDEERKKFREYYFESIINISKGTPYKMEVNYLDVGNTKTLLNAAGVSTPEEGDYRDIAAKLAIQIHKTNITDLEDGGLSAIPYEKHCSGYTLDIVKDYGEKRKSKNILIFVPTVSDVIDITRRIDAIRDPELETFAFYRGASGNIGDVAGKRKRVVIVATNVAETGTTIPGLRYVIDTGLANDVLYNPVMDLEESSVGIVTRNSMLQRWGRVGRTAPGVVYALYNKNEFENFPDNRIPQIIRAPFTIALQHLHFDYKHEDDDDVFNLLTKANLIEPPPPESVAIAYDKMFRNGFLNSNMRLTVSGTIGVLLSVSSLEIQRLLILAPFYQCSDAIRTIVAMIETDTIMAFASSLPSVATAEDHSEKGGQDKDTVRESAAKIASHGSDFLNALWTIQRIAGKVLREKKGPGEMGFSASDFQKKYEEVLDFEEQIFDSCTEAGLPSWDVFNNEDSYNYRVLKCISEAFSANVATYDEEYKGYIPDRATREAFSVVSGIRSAPAFITNELNPQRTMTNINKNYAKRLVYDKITIIGEIWV